MEISKFYEKLNKIEGNIYVIEEKAELTGGVYDAPLQHDNINTSTLSVYTGPKLTGERIQTYVLSTPSLTPWKRTIRIYSDVPVVYISYEAEGDTVEAEDVNQLQEEVVRTQEAVNEEVSRAQEAEQEIIGDLGKEVARAKMAEQTLSESLTAEINRSTGAEQELSWGLTAEINRAKEAERANTDNQVTETTRALAAEESIRSTIQNNKPNWDDKYTRNEVDNKFASLENDIDWKETVNTYANIAEAYPNPQDGWTVNVKDTDYTYRYSGTEWVVISANAIPKATQSVDGLLSKEDKALYDDANSKKHTHGNKTTIDKITETLLSRWNEAFDKRHEHGNKGILDMITQALLDSWSAAFTHVSDVVKHITAAERANWNDADSKKHSHSNKTILDGITQALIDHWNAAEMNVQADWNVTDTASDAYVKNKPTSLPASDVSAWAKASTKPGYAWSEISGKPTSFSPAAHTHTKSQITDMSTKVSEFENDTGYITAADIDTSQNHTHANKSVLDTLTQTLLNNWNAAYTHISNKSNPHGVTAAQVGALESSQLSNSDNLDEIKIPGFYFAGGGNAVIGKPSGIDAFGLQVYKTASGYVTQDLIAGTGNPYKRYTRQWSNSVWSDWIPLPTFTSAPVSGQVVISDGVTGGIKSSGFTIAKSVPSNAAFTDTVYTHPNSGVIAGTYRSVTVNTQGHVTSGSNPTTLADYGITDAAAKTHNHDITYLKRTGLTWDDLKGV
ncbi:pyocin knob domain-containing protein [Lacrimispora celerecrescens]|uniref:pyocin knob domain-containing protein n=1 Tax=Lacrimispora celerecrescens TaxID=29354 RepID=UPI001649CE8B|nr:pyocin knob domain-containing protein [Lacrimispora celerecrescens]